MTVEYNFVSIIDLLALVQGIILGLLLIAANHKNRPSLFLGMFLLTYALELINAILSDTNVLHHYPKWLFLPVNFHLLSVPLLYLYAKSLVQPVSVKKHLLFLLPGIIEFVVFLILFLLPLATKLSILENNVIDMGYPIYDFLSLTYSIFVAILILKLISRHQNQVMDYFSNADNRKLQWVKIIAFFIILFYGSWLVFLILPIGEENQYVAQVLSAINVTFIYWVGISGLQQPKVEMSKDTESEIEPGMPEMVSDSNDTSGTEMEESNKLFTTLLQLMEAHKRYIDPDLTLPTLAHDLNISRKNLSQLINQKSGTNFNTFINKYRVLEAKRLLSDSNFNHLNMLGVAYEVGFNSKATFFAVFKQMEGVSPGVYKKQVDESSNVPQNLINK